MHITPEGQIKYRILYQGQEFAIEITNSEGIVHGPFAMKICNLSMDVYEFQHKELRHTVYFFM